MKRKKRSMRWLAIPVGLVLAGATILVLLTGPPVASRRVAAVAPAKSSPAAARAPQRARPAAQPRPAPKASDEISDESRAQLRAILRAADEEEGGRP